MFEDYIDDEMAEYLRDEIDKSILLKITEITENIKIIKIIANSDSITLDNTIGVKKI